MRSDGGGDVVAIVLAGGRARRLGGETKPARAVGGTPLLVRVLEAVRGAASRVVVGPAELDGLLPPGVLRTSEEPPGAGPVAAIAAGLGVLPTGPNLVAVLGGDLPFVDEATLWTLRKAVGGEGLDGADLDGADLDGAEVDAAVVVDDSGRPQWMLGVWRTGALTRRLDSLRADGGLDGRGMRELAATVRLAEVRVATADPPPWFDCDTEDDLRQAEEWTRGDAG